MGPVEGEGVRAPISIFPPNGGRGTVAIRLCGRVAVTRGVSGRGAWSRWVRHGGRARASAVRGAVRGEFRVGSQAQGHGDGFPPPRERRSWGRERRMSWAQGVLQPCWVEPPRAPGFPPRIGYGAGSARERRIESPSLLRGDSGQAPPSPVEGEGVLEPGSGRTRGSAPTTGESPSPQPSPSGRGGGSPSPQPSPRRGRGGMGAGKRAEWVRPYDRGITLTPALSRQGRGGLGAAPVCFSRRGRGGVGGLFVADYVYYELFGGGDPVVGLEAVGPVLHDVVEELDDGVRRRRSGLG